MNVPSLGRIVLYRPTPQEWEYLRGYRPPASDAQLPAIVVAVSYDEYGPGKHAVNLRVFGDNCFAPPWYVYRQEGQEPGTWSWPPRL